jgi:hypothetical protein
MIVLRACANGRRAPHWGPRRALRACAEPGRAKPSANGRGQRKGPPPARAGRPRAPGERANFVKIRYEVFCARAEFAASLPPARPRHFGPCSTPPPVAAAAAEKRPLPRPIPPSPAGRTLAARRAPFGRPVGGLASCRRPVCAPPPARSLVCARLAPSVAVVVFVAAPYRRCVLYQSRAARRTLRAARASPGALWRVAKRIVYIRIQWVEPAACWWLALTAVGRETRGRGNRAPATDRREREKGQAETEIGVRTRARESSSERSARPRPAT